MNTELNVFTLRMLRDQYDAEHMDTEVEALDAAIKALEEIIRCKDCKKRVYCRTSRVWAVAPSDNLYCADAERKEDG